MDWSGGRGGMIRGSILIGLNAPLVLGCASKPLPKIIYPLAEYP